MNEQKTSYRHNLPGKSVSFIRVLLLSLCISQTCFCSTSSIDSISQKYTVRYRAQQPGHFVCPITRLDTTKKVIGLTFDACGGPGGNGYDQQLIKYLRKEKIPALLFINTRWAQSRPEIFQELCADPLFTIGSHGTQHRPCTITPHKKYGIRATSSIPALIREVEGSARLLQKLGAPRPRYFRSGTAWYDEGSLKIIEELGYTVVNFDINSRDYDGFNSGEKIASYILTARAGSIIIMHMNHPKRSTCEALQIALPILRKQGYSFVRVEDYDLKTTIPVRQPE